MALYDTQQTAIINTAGSGDTVIVAAVTGKRIRVINYVLTAAGVVSVTFRSGTTALTGAMPLAANGGISVAGAQPGFWLQTAAGEALNLSLSAAVQVSGHITYDVAA